MSLAFLAITCLIEIKTYLHPLTFTKNWTHHTRTLANHFITCIKNIVYLATLNVLQLINRIRTLR